MSDLLHVSLVQVFVVYLVALAIDRVREAEATPPIPTARVVRCAPGFYAEGARRDGSTTCAMAPPIKGDECWGDNPCDGSHVRLPRYGVTAGCLPTEIGLLDPDARGVHCRPRKSVLLPEQITADQMRRHGNEWW